MHILKHDFYFIFNTIETILNSLVFFLKKKKKKHKDIEKWQFESQLWVNIIKKKI